MKKPLFLPKIALVVYGLVFLYITVLNGMVIRPTILPYNVQFRLIPFDFLLTIYSVSQGVIISGYDLMETLPSILWDNLHGFVFNILLLIPFGLLVPLVYEKYANLKAIALSGLALVLAKETVKVILSFFGLVFNRFFRVDNLIAGMIGVLLGYLLFCLCKHLAAMRKKRTHTQHPTNG